MVCAKTGIVRTKVTVSGKYFVEATAKQTPHHEEIVKSLVLQMQEGRVFSKEEAKAFIRTQALQRA